MNQDSGFRPPFPILRRGMSLQTRFLLYFGSVVVALMALVILLVGQRQLESALSQIERRGEVIAESLASASTNALLSYDYTSIQRLADEMANETETMYVILHDKENTVAGFSGHAELQGREMNDPISVAANQGLDIVRQTHTGIDDDLPGFGQEVLEIAVPVTVGNSTARWGTVRVGLSLQEMRAELWSTLRDLILLGAFAVAIVLWSARFFTSQITGPLKELAEATAEVASGHLDHTLDEDLVGELGDTARGFNKMTEDLRRSRDAIRYQKRHLENMVQERTAALRQKARELEKANQELKEVDRLKSDFLSNVSHELRTPLTSIRSFTEILLDGSGAISPEESAEFLGIIAGQTDRLTRLIGDLLDLSRIEAGEFHCQLEPMPLAQFVITPCMETVSRLAEECNITITAEVEEDLPPVFGDADRLSQVVMNLVDNALKFTNPGGSLELRARTSPQRVPRTSHGNNFYGLQADTPESGSYVVVSLKDSGTGIPEADRQRIFEKFGQVGNVLTNKPQGTGLGLAISSNIVVQHGGALWVESEENKGSTFFISIPVSSEAQERTTTRSRSNPVAAVRNADDVVASLERMQSGSRVLVVDDDERSVRRLVNTLEPLGYRALSCLGGRSAAERVRELGPDTVVLDALMSDMNGYDVLRELKQDPRTKDIPVIVIGPASEMNKAYELGAALHVSREKESTVAAVVSEPVFV